MESTRPDPQKLLKRVQETEAQASRGKLKIYFGAYPGVGKTYTMLKEAIALREQGLDIVVGLAESHGRIEIETMLKQLEHLPKQALTYREKTLYELDIDAVLKRDPALVLIDELAHTNVPGSRHAKRWQDIEEILARGIDVATTLNVQHLESLNDVVTQIIHTPIQETVPDSVLTMATTIELVDLPPDDLLKRLEEGKVYVPEQAALAKESFFKKGNLIALRELALRVTAERVETEVLLYRQDFGIKTVWPTKHKILVCVGNDAASIKLLRSAKRLVNTLELASKIQKIKVTWIAVHVDSPTFIFGESPQKEERLKQNLDLAEKLGADIRILNDLNIAKAILDFAREQNVTQIIVGKKIRTRWQDLIFGSLADEIVRLGKGIDVSIISSEADALPSNESVSPKSTAVPRIPWVTYGLAVSMVAVITGFNFLIYPLIRPNNSIMLYLLGVILVALSGKIGPTLVATILSVLSFDYFLMPPTYGDNGRLEYFITLTVMMVVAIVISYLTILSRRQTFLAKESEKRTAFLHKLSQQLTSVSGIDKIRDQALAFLVDAFHCEAAILITEEDRLNIRGSSDAESVLSEKDQGIVQWVLDLGRMAGLGTDTLSFSKSLFLPLSGSHGTLGVLKLRPQEEGQTFSETQIKSLEACANQIAVAIEAEQVGEEHQKLAIRLESDRVQNALLKNLTKDLRKPLISIMSNATTQMEMASTLDAGAIEKIANEIYNEAEQMNRLVHNLLQIVYLESEKVVLKKMPMPLKKIIDAFMINLNKKMKKKVVYLHIPSELPEISVDEALIKEVFLNLFDNAVKFTPPDTPIDISATVKETWIIVSVEDRGPGIVSDEVNRLFEKFYRGREITTEWGLGLGLAICQKIITVHGGEIWAENRVGGGAAFRFSLPIS